MLRQVRGKAEKSVLDVATLKTYFSAISDLQNKQNPNGFLPGEKIWDSRVSKILETHECAGTDRDDHDDDFDQTKRFEIDHYLIIQHRINKNIVATDSAFGKKPEHLEIC